MIESIVTKVNIAANLSDETVERKSQAIIDFARRRFTRNAFIESFGSFLTEIKNEKQPGTFIRRNNYPQVKRVIEVSRSA